MTDLILTLNAGSSSLKFALFEPGAAPVAGPKGIIDETFSAPRMITKDPSGRQTSERMFPKAMPFPELVREVINWAEDQYKATLGAVGHRVVHGGSQFTAPQIVSEKLLADLDALVDHGDSEVVIELLRNTGATIEEPASFLMKLAREKRPRDRVILVNGDQVVGTIAGLDRAGNCTMMVEAAVETIPPARLAGFSLGEGDALRRAMGSQRSNDRMERELVVRLTSYVRDPTDGYAVADDLLCWPLPRKKSQQRRRRNLPLPIIDIEHGVVQGQPA